MKTLKDFISEHQIEMTKQRVEHRPDGHMDDKGMRHWLCTIKQVGRGNPAVMTLFFSQGSAHTKPPTVEDVLDCIAADCSGALNARGFEDWASEYGYDPDSRKAEDTYRACQIQLRDIERLLGAKLVQELVYETERL